MVRNASMLGIGMQEIIIILIVALIVIGPKKLPDLARALGRAMAEFRRAADDLKKDFEVDEVRRARESVLKDLYKTPPPQETTATETTNPPAAEAAKEEKEDKIRGNG